MQTNDFLIVEDDKTLVRDTKTGAILNTDVEGLQAYKRRRSIAAQQQKRIENLESSMEEVKSLLNTLITELQKDKK